MLNEIDLARVDLNLLVLFEAVLAEKNVGRAAVRLHLTASAVSHGLGRLRTLLNDPLFLRTLRGVTPTDRALELAAPVTEVLARIRAVMATAEPFDPGSSRRRFTIGAPDGTSAVLLPPSLAELARHAPGIDIGMLQLLPDEGVAAPEHAWGSAFAALESRVMDIAVLPLDQVPVRFAKRELYQEEFVIGVRAGHPFSRRPTLDRYCKLQHLVVSQNASAQGFVDTALAAAGRTRRVSVTVPNFMIALALLAESDHAAALPQRLLQRYARRFGLKAVAPPVPLPRFRIQAVASHAALMDEGIAWMFGRLTA